MTAILSASVPARMHSSSNGQIASSSRSLPRVACGGGVREYARSVSRWLADPPSVGASECDPRVAQASRGSVSMIVRMGVRRSLLNLVVISLHSRQSAARIARGREDQTYPGGPHLRPGATRNRRDHHPTSSITLRLSVAKYNPRSGSVQCRRRNGLTFETEPKARGATDRANKRLLSLRQPSE